MVHPSDSPTKNPRTELRHFRIRIMARLLVLFIAITQLGQRLYMAFALDDLSHPSAEVYLRTLPFLGAMSAIVLIEYLIYRRIGSRILKYSTYVDILFTLVFTAEWLTVMYAALIQVKDGDSTCYGVSAIFSFTSFSWRTLIQGIISQHWQFKVFPPVCVYALSMWFAIDNTEGVTQFILIRGLLQTIYVFLIFYFENKINFKLMLFNLEHKKWVQINEFIFNNIPENIAIFDLEGRTQFISGYFKEFMGKHSHSHDINQFMKIIMDLHLQEETSPASLKVSAYHTLKILTNYRTKHSTEATPGKPPTLPILISEALSTVSIHLKTLWKHSRIWPRGVVSETIPSKFSMENSTASSMRLICVL